MVQAPKSAHAPQSLDPALRLLVVASLLALAAAGWYAVLRYSSGMHGMGLAALASTGMPMSLSGSVFMVMWLAMMIAMMFPSVVPFALLFTMIARSRGEGPPTTIVFMSGYLAVWLAFGLIPLTVFLGLQAAAPAVANWLPLTAGLILLGAGVYQFTLLKTVCLRVCRKPLSFLMTHDFGAGFRAAFKMGAAHGAYCLGCCWALMCVLVVVGLMNLAWMAVLTLVFFLEKNWRHGKLVGRVAGAAVAALGLAVIAGSTVLARISGV